MATTETDFDSETELDEGSAVEPNALTDDQKMKLDALLKRLADGKAVLLDAESREELADIRAALFEAYQC